MNWQKCRLQAGGHGDGATEKQEEDTFMEAIVAVYSDWGIGAGGAQPVALAADRKFFRQTTQGAWVIVGRKTLADFPGGRPLPKRVNLVLTRGDMELPGAVVVHSPQEAAEKAKDAERVFVIGGASVYRQMLPCCDKVHVTKVGACPQSDVFFPNLDESPEWVCTDPGEEQTEDGISYRFCTYEKVKGDSHGR